MAIVWNQRASAAELADTLERVVQPLDLAYRVQLISNEPGRRHVALDRLMVAKMASRIHGPERVIWSER